MELIMSSDTDSILRITARDLFITLMMFKKNSSGMVWKKQLSVN